MRSLVNVGVKGSLEDSGVPAGAYGPHGSNGAQRDASDKDRGIEALRMVASELLPPRHLCCQALAASLLAFSRLLLARMLQPLLLRAI